MIRTAATALTVVNLYKRVTEWGNIWWNPGNDSLSHDFSRKGPILGPFFFCAFSIGKSLRHMEKFAIMTATKNKRGGEVETERCICSVLSLLKGECAQETAAFLTKVLWERTRQRVLYVPAGIQFENVGTVSMTELYFSYRKSQPLFLPFRERKPVFVKPFHCFLESEEIEDAQYYGFITKLAETADCMMVSLDGLSPGRLHWFLENSSMVAVLAECVKGAPSPQFLGFLHNLKLLWGEELGARLNRFLFLLPGGGQEEKDLMQKQLRAEGIFLAQEEENMVFVTEEDIGRQKTAFWKRAKENGRKPI